MLDTKCTGATVSVIGKHLSAIESPYRLPYPDGFFDVVVSNTVMEHVMDYDQTLAELGRLLKPGGVFLHSFPARWIPIEPHTFVPLATVLRTQWWLRLWASFGVRNSFQTNASATWTLKNCTYLRDHTTYLKAGDLMRYFRRYFSEVRFVEIEFLRSSPHTRGQVLAKLAAVIPFVSHLYRSCWNRVLFGRR